MWNNPKVAPEYQMGWGYKEIVKQGLSKILNWSANKVILSHGELVEQNVNDVLSSAWDKILKA